LEQRDGAAATLGTDVHGFRGFRAPTGKVMSLPSFSKRGARRPCRGKGSCRDGHLRRLERNRRDSPLSAHRVHGLIYPWPPGFEGDKRRLPGSAPRLLRGSLQSMDEHRMTGSATTLPTGSSPIGQ
jgi:hypothetical protein